MEKLKIASIIAISTILLYALFMFFSLFLFGINDFGGRTGEYVDREKSKGYRYGRRNKNKIFYFSNVALGDTPQEIKEADRESFEVIGAYWAKDKHAVYHKNERITNADTASFTVNQPTKGDETGQKIIKDKNHVYHLSPNHSGLLVAEHADPATFRDMGKHGANHWATDKEHIFLNYEVFDADRASFEIISSRFAKDRNHLFINDYRIRVREKVNAAELKLLNSYHIKTNSRVWFFSGRPEQPTSFPITKNSRIEVFQSNLKLLKVDNGIFAKGVKNRDKAIDVANFKYVGSNSYFSDGRRIYYCAWNLDSIIPMSADAGAFTTIGNFGKDSRYVYFRNHVIEDADPATFQYDKKNDRSYDSKNEYVYDLKQNLYIKREKKK